MSVTLERHDGPAVLADAALRTRLGEIYVEAFGRPPHNHRPRDGQAWAEGGLVQHAGYPGFGLVTAVSQDDGEILGFGYGLLGSDDQWFTQMLRQRLSAAVADEWVGAASGQGELVELAVIGRTQGQGIGGLIHDAVLANLAEAGTDRAVLVTHREAASARALYARRGWLLVAELDADSLLMGIRLPHVGGSGAAV